MTTKPSATPSTIVVARVVTNPVKDTLPAIAEVAPRLREAVRVITGHTLSAPRRRFVGLHPDAITLGSRTDNEPTQHPNRGVPAIRTPETVCRTVADRSRLPSPPHSAHRVFFVP
ncbi:hypothetical protein CH259_23215 [Rhodococcus sp. 05-2254-4]|nr:hypothetical protein CH259_23215 [Rhodococcus sp. 05-2254-4]OZE43822.1 hypothetical protein CH261_15430 [Rhodococcus sp. 05-2254-3]OZE56494.1 hypothetical protein CH283_03480 [Rhodococcus sp. 05-2254-2]